MSTSVEDKQQYIERKLRAGMSAEDARKKADELDQGGGFGDFVGEVEMPVVDIPPVVKPTAVLGVPDAEKAKAPTPEVPGPPDIRVEDFLGNLGKAYKARIEQPDVAPEPGIIAPRSIAEVVVFHSKDLGLQPNEFKMAARSRGLDIDYMIKEVGRRGRDPAEVIEEARKRGVSEFAGPKARELAQQKDMIRKTAIERYEARGEEVPRWLSEPPRKEYEFSDERAWFETDPTEAPEVMKAGEKGQDGRMAGELWKEAIEKPGGDELARSVDAWNKGLVSGHGFIQERVETLINNDDEFKNLSGQAKDDQHLDYTRQAMYEMALAKTVGAWTGSTFIPYASLNAKEVTLAQSMMPSIEVIGINANKKVVLRQQSGLSYVFEMADLPQAIVAGVGSDLVKGEYKGLQSVSNAIAARKDFATMAWEETEGKSLSTRAAWTLVGFGAAVAFPDLLMGAGGVARMATRPYRVRQAAQAGAMLGEIATARAAQDWAGSAAAEARFRSAHPKLADELDRVDEDVARNLTFSNRDIADKKLASALPSELSDEVVNLHASHRKSARRVEGSQTIAVDYNELYGTKQHLDRIQALRDQIEAGTHINVERINRNMSMAQKAVGEATKGIAGAKTEAQKLINEMFDVDNLRLMTTDEAAWRAKFTDKASGKLYNLKSLPSVRPADIKAAEDAGNAVEAQRLTTIIRARRELHGFVEGRKRKGKVGLPGLVKTVQESSKRGAKDLALLDRAEEAILTNSESRAAAALLLRDQLYGSVKKVAPKLEVTSDIAEAMKIPDLSPEALLAVESVLSAFTDMSREQAQKIMAINDVMARRWGVRMDLPAADWPGWKIEYQKGTAPTAAPPLRAGETVLFQADEVEDTAAAATKGEDPAFYSKLSQVAGAMPPGKHGLDAVIPMMRRNGAKAEEIKWTNLEEFIEDARAAGKKSLSKEEILKHLDENQVVTSEKTMGGMPPAIKAAKKAAAGAFKRLAPVLEEAGLEADGIHRVSTYSTPNHRSLLTLDPADPLGVLEKAFVGVVAPSERHKIASLQHKHLSPARRESHPTRLKSMVEAIDNLYRSLQIAHLPYAFEKARKALLPIREFRAWLKSAEGQQWFAQANDPLLLDTVSRWESHAKQIVDIDMSWTDAIGTSAEWKAWAPLQREATRLVGEGASEGPGPTWDGWVLGDSGENYREVLITLPPSKKVALNYEYKRVLGTMDPFTEDHNVSILKQRPPHQLTPNERRLVELWDEMDKLPEEPIHGVAFDDSMGSHWEEPNVLVHIRASDRVDEEGRKILYVEEIQSDWHQKGRKHGYQGQKVTLPDNVESAIQEMESNKKAIDAWRAANPRPPNYQRGLEVVQGSGLDPFELMLPEKVGPWKKTLSKEDLDAYNAQKSWFEKAYGVGTKPGELVTLIDTYHASVKGVEVAADKIGLRLHASGGTIRRSGGGMPQSEVPHGRLRDEFAEHLSVGSPVPDAPFKDTKAWASLAVKRIMKIAADEGYTGIAFPTGAIASKVVQMPLAAAKAFYDTILPSVVKKHAKAPVRKHWFDDGRSPNGVEVPFVELTPEVVARVGRTQPLFQRDEVTAVPKAATIFRDNAHTIIRAYEKADVSSLVHELGHVYRRELDDADLDIVQSWLKAEHGLDVTHNKAGRFVGTAADVEKAEEMFARGFERYLREGKAPSHRLGQIFEDLKAWMTDIYKTIVGTEIDVKMTTEMTDLFNRMLRDGAPEVGLPRINQFIADKVTKKKKMSLYAHIVAQARRAGVALDEEDLKNQLVENKVIQLPIELDLGDGHGARSSLTEGEFALANESLRNRQATAAAMEEPSLAINAAVDSVRETSAADRVDQLASKSPWPIKVIKGLVLGGDPDSALRDLPPSIRKTINAGVSKVNEAVGNFVTVLAETTTDWDKAFRYLSGETIEFKSGRQAYSSGYDCVAPVAKSLRRTIGTIGEDEIKALTALANVFEEGLAKGKSLTKIVAGMPKHGVASHALADLDQPLKNIDDAVKQLLSQKGEDSLIKAIMEAVELEPVRQADRVTPPVKALKLVEVLGYFAGVTTRGGDVFDGNSYERAEMLVANIRDLFDDQKARRVALLVAGHGHAQAARDMWTKLGISVTEDVRAAFLKWVNGESIPLEMLPQVKNVVLRYGLNPNFLDNAILDTSLYLPQQARQRLGDSLARASDMRTAKILSTASEQEMRGLFSGLLRYVKKMMTRGAYITRPRYFLMNTFDHFNQMAMITGYRSAAASTARLALQNLLAVPGAAQFLQTLEFVKLAPDQAAERLRRILQKGGDKFAQTIGDSKYRIEVNAILESHSGVLHVGDQVYTYRQLRDVAVEEGIFASFDTSEMKKAVDLSTPNWQNKLAQRLDPLGWQKLTGDVAEAWAERERLGAMVTLIEGGATPRQAARLTIDALYDYAGSMSKMDRAWFVSLISPFWAFQKNANRQVLNGMFTPKVAYRMGALRRAEEIGPEMLTQVLYEFVAEPYGVDVDNMPIEAQDNYWTLRKLVEDHYGGPHEVPRNARLALRMLFAERAIGVVAGDYIDLDTLLQEANQITALGTEAYSVRHPDPSARPQYLRDRSGIAITLPRTEAVRGFMRHINATQSDYPWTEVFLPESTVHAGMRHLAGMAAFFIISGELIVETATDATGLTDLGMAKADPRVALRTVSEPERNPVSSQALALWLDSPQSMRALRVHSSLVPILETLGYGVAKYEGVDDPIWAEVETQRGVSPEEAGVSTVRYYISPGLHSFALDTSPVGELNKLLKLSEKSPLERTHWSGEILRWARAFLGLQTSEIHRPRTVRMDEKRFVKEETKPPTR